MKKLLLSLFLATFALLTAQGQLTLGSSPYTQSFDAIGSGLPTGWTVRTGATSGGRGTSASFTATATSWADVAGAFKNFASADNLTSGANATAQSSESDRALGVRQSSGLGDPGAAFELHLANTSGKANFNLTFKHQMLNVQARSTTWTVQYSTSGTSWTTLGTYTDPGTFGSTTGNYSFGTALDDIATAVYIRIVALTAASGSNNRDSYGIDDVELSWSSASTPTLSVSPSSLDFGTEIVLAASASQSFELSGSNFTNASGDITVSAPSTDFQVSLNDMDFGSSVDVAFASNALSATTVYVRFVPQSAGAKAGDITFSNPGGVASLPTVALTGTGEAACAAPSTQTDAVVVDAAGAYQIDGLFDNATGGADFYLVVVSENMSLSADPVDGTTYSVGDALGGGTVAAIVNDVDEEFSATGLTPNTTYYFFVFAFNNTACAGGPAYNTTSPATDDATTDDGLAAGDLAVVGYTLDAPDEICIVALDSIQAGTEIKVTDNGWNDNNTFRPNEQTATITLPGMAFGEVYCWETTNLSNDGDQIILYIGDNATPTFIYALGANRNGWEGDATDSNTSALPTGLVNGTTAVTISNAENAYYDAGPFPDVDKNLALFLIANEGNWAKYAMHDTISDPSDHFAELGPLPVELTHFSARAEGSQVRLSWATASEDDNSHFEVEHSTNGTDFAPIGRVQGAGTTQQAQQYSFLHERPAAINYYRLRQVDFSGAAEYTGTVVVSFKGNATAKLYPNPVREELRVEGNFEAETLLTLFNTLGQPVLTQIVPAGTPVARIATDALPAGTYTLQYNGQAFRFVKQ